MIIGNHVEKVEKDDKVVLGNKENGKWIRLSNEVYEIINHILAQKYLIEELKEAFESEEDYLFIQKIYKSLIESNMICSEEYIPNIQNKIASVQLTNRCNLKCTHCCVDANSDDNIHQELTTEQIKTIFNKLIIWNPISINLSGGEPLIRKDFMELAEYLRESYNGKIILSTNSLFINKDNIEKLVMYCDNFDISIDGIDEETCSIVRGKGVFDKVCHNVEMLKSFGVTNISLSMVFSDKNQKLKQRFIDLNNKLGTIPLCRNFSAVGRGLLNKEIFTEKNEEDYYIPSNYLAEDYSEAFGISFCSAGKKEIFIGCDGTVYPCPSYMSNNFAIGNALACDKIEDLLKDNNGEYVCENVAKFHPRNIPKCKDCEVGLFCWTCPGELRDIKTEKAFNKRCETMKPILLKRVWGQ